MKNDMLIKGPFQEATGGGSEKQKLDKLIKSSLKIKLLRRQNDKMIVVTYIFFLQIDQKLFEN
jgi:hypothetical protein